MAPRSTTTFPPLLPPGRRLELPGRGTTFIRELAGPPGAPTLLLLHGWIATADLNWWTSYRELAREFHVVAMDHRGHGRGIRPRHRFRLVDCAGDAAAVIQALGLGPTIVVGYSMGGPIAQLTWRDHPREVRGLVLCATSRSFPTGARERAAISAFGYGVSLTPGPVRHRALGMMLSRGGGRPAYTEWMMDELKGHRMGDILEAGRELGRFNSAPWIGAVDVPTDVIVMTRDAVVPPGRQYQLARAIPGAVLREVEGDHIACSTSPGRFVPALVAACRDVARRSEAPRAA